MDYLMRRDASISPHGTRVGALTEGKGRVRCHPSHGLVWNKFSLQNPVDYSIFHPFILWVLNFQGVEEKNSSDPHRGLGTYDICRGAKDQHVRTYFNRFRNPLSSPLQPNTRAVRLSTVNGGAIGSNCREWHTIAAKTFTYKSTSSTLRASLMVLKNEQFSTPFTEAQSLF